MTADANQKLLDNRFQRVDEKIKDLKEGTHEKLDNILTIVNTLASDQKSQYNHITKMQNDIVQLTTKHDTCRINEIEENLGNISTETQGIRFIAKNIKVFVYSILVLIVLVLAKDGATFIGWVKKVLGL
jgi:hypothetical protein